MRCTKCGVDNDENALYCKNCGQGLTASTSMDTRKKGVPKHIKKIVYPGWIGRIRNMLIKGLYYN